jgi:hypothetical protein
MTEPQAHEHYFALVQRAGDPQDGDRELLREVLLTLGRKPDQFRQDVATLAQARALTAEVEQHAASAHDLHQAASAEAAELDAKIASMRRELEELERQRLHTLSEAGRASDARRASERSLAELKRQHRELLAGVKLLPPTMPPSETIESKPENPEVLRRIRESFGPRDNVADRRQSFGPQPGQHEGIVNRRN